RELRYRRQRRQLIRATQLEHEHPSTRALRPPHCETERRAARLDRDVLLATDRVRHRPGHRYGLRVQLPELLAGGRAIRDELLLARAFENQIACGGHRAARTAAGIFHAPDFLLLHGIVSKQVTGHGLGGGFRTNGRVLLRWLRTHVRPDADAEFL